MISLYVDFTNITIRKDWELLDSGLLGPVQILVVPD
jgi:hypothetical protein